MTANAVFETRRRNMTRLLRLRGRGAKADLAMRLDTTQPHISHWLREPGRPNARPIHEDSARAIEKALKLQPGDLDVDPNLPAEMKGVRPQMAAALAAAERRAEQAADGDLVSAVARAVLSEMNDVKGPKFIEKAGSVMAVTFKDAVEHGGKVDHVLVKDLVALMI